MKRLLTALLAAGSMWLAAPSHAQVLAQKEWGSVQGLAADGGKLYAATGQGVFELDIATGQDRRIGQPEWRQVTRLTVLDGDVYFVADADLWAVKPGAEPRKIEAQWSPVGGITAHQGRIYLVHGERLVGVGKTGGASFVSAPWYGTAALVSAGKELYALADSKLQLVELPKGTSRVIASFDRPCAMAAIGSKLYVFTHEGPHGARKGVLMEFDMAAGGKRRTLPSPIPYEYGTDAPPAMTALGGKLYFGHVAGGKVVITAAEPR